MRLPRLRPVAMLGLACGVGALGATALVGTGCGLRSDPLFTADTDLPTDTEGETETETETETGTDVSESGDIEPPVEGRLGSCTNVIDLPSTDSSANGTLRGPGLYSGVCGDDDGLEDVYRFVPAAATDVTIVFDASNTEFAPTVRVQENGCMTDEGLVRTCTNDWFDGDAAKNRHFLAFGNREYFIHIDSRDGNGGDYAFDVVLGPPPLEQCDPHPETIFQAPGSIFRWENDFLGGQGLVDSQCGGLGRENMFPVEMASPGPVSISVSGFNGFRPVVGLRRDCSAITELGCASEQTLQTPGFAFFETFVDAPGRYYVTVDNLDLNPGTYQLEVAF